MCTGSYVNCTANICDGGWSTWSPWSMCNASCNGGVTVRSRSCSMPPPSNGGAGCEGESMETEECNVDPCPGWLECYSVIYLPSNKILINNKEKLLEWDLNL